MPNVRRSESSERGPMLRVWCRPLRSVSAAVPTRVSPVLLFRRCDALVPLEPGRLVPAPIEVRAWPVRSYRVFNGRTVAARFCSLGDLDPLSGQGDTHEGLSETPKGARSCRFRLSFTNVQRAVGHYPRCLALSPS